MYRHKLAEANNDPVICTEFSHLPMFAIIVVIILAYRMSLLLFWELIIVVLVLSDEILFIGCSCDNLNEC